MLAHGGTEAVNTWGFAYVGGVIGLFSLSLLYVKGRLDQRDRPRTNTPAVSIASLGPSMIVVGGVCGVSLGLGVAGLLNDVVDEDVNVDDIVMELCDMRTSGSYELSSGLHRDVVHAIDDLDLAAADGAHRTLHNVATSPAAAEADWVESIDQLAAAFVASDDGTARACSGTGATN